jgi:hypothetical protein
MGRSQRCLGLGALLLTLWLGATVGPVAHTAHAPGASMLGIEVQITRIERSLAEVGHGSFIKNFANGRLREKHVAYPDRDNFVRFNASGGKQVEWSRKSHGIVRYQSWYSNNKVKELLLEDDRSLAYQSFYKTGRKWQDYRYNKLKKIKSLYVYDKNGKLLESKST